MPQQIIDLDAAAPEDIGVKLGGEIYALPGDIEIPRLLKIERLMGRLGAPADEESDGEGSAFLDLYEEVLELFRIRDPEVEELPMGARQLGALVVRLYTTAAEADGEDEEDRPPRASTRSTSKRSKKSRSSRS